MSFLSSIFFFCSNFLQVLCLSSPTHDSNCCFLHGDALNGSLRTRSPSKTSSQCSAFCIHARSSRFLFDQPRLFWFLLRFINMYLFCACNISLCFMRGIDGIVSQFLFSPFINSYELLACGSVFTMHSLCAVYLINQREQQWCSHENLMNSPE